MFNYIFFSFLFFFCSEQGCLWLGLVFFQGGDWCGKIQIIKVKFWKFVFCLLFVPHHLSSFSFCSFSFFLFNLLFAQKNISHLNFKMHSQCGNFYTMVESSGWSKNQKRVDQFFICFVCLFVAVWRCKKFVCFDFLKTFHVPNTKSLCGGWWFQLWTGD